MTMPRAEAITEISFQPEIQEVKKQVQYRDLDDSLSEWERARQSSKTWSMEQD